jgi:F-type H+-transporting ATPase subunit epsilon
MIDFQLITPERIVLKEEVYEVLLPTDLGQIGILPHHAPLITLVKPGVIVVRRNKADRDDQLEHIATSGGFVEVANNSVKLMADTAEMAHELDEAEVQARIAKAKREAAEAKDQAQYAGAVGAIEAELARIKVINIKRRHGSTRSSINPENIQ